MVLRLFMALFAILGIIFVVALMYYFYLRREQQVQQSVAVWPPPNYMENVGLRCPTSWVYKGVDSNGNYVCQNQYNIDMYNEKYGNETAYACYDNPAEKETTFTPLQKWPIREQESAELLKDRCEWVRNCGPNQGQHATWIGVSDFC